MGLRMPTANIIRQYPKYCHGNIPGLSEMFGHLLMLSKFIRRLEIVVNLKFWTHPISFCCLYINIWLYCHGNIPGLSEMFGHLLMLSKFIRRLEIVVNLKFWTHPISFCCLYINIWLYIYKYTVYYTIITVLLSIPIISSKKDDHHQPTIDHQFHPHYGPLNPQNFDG